MSKFIFAFFKKESNKYLVKAIVENLNNNDEIWMEATKAVYNYAKANFEEGQDCNIEYTEEDGVYKVTRITKGEGATKKTTTKAEDTGYKCEDCGKPLKDGKYKKCYTCNKKSSAKKTNKTAEYVCEDCGKALKDGKYKKCFECNQKNPVKKATSTYTKSPEVQESIKRQAIGHMTSRTLISLQGHINPNNVGEIIKTIYAIYVDLVG